MGAINESLAEQVVSAAASPADEIIWPTTARNPNERVWLTILTDATEDIRLVDGVGDTTGTPIAAASGTVVAGPYHLAAIIAGRGPHFIHAANPVSIPVQVSRDG